MSATSKPRFQRIGDIAILSSPVPREEAEGLLRELKVKTVCVKEGPVSGELRQPRVRVLAGNGTETIHKEAGCLYKLDVSRVMFSKGNMKERHRPAGLVRPGEVVVDMFAGIGYFSAPVALACPGCKVWSIELNPDAVHYLKENIRLNKVSNVQVLEGDCRKVQVPEKADRVLMGYLPGTEKFLPAAFRFLKPRGVIHFHNTYREEELWDKPLQTLGEEAEKAGYKLEKVL
ncbi:MAG: class I SAM-dependent methyltransferase family protein, partial [Candidatus Aenigmatarchaeota archaeon]